MRLSNDIFSIRIFGSCCCCSDVWAFSLITNSWAKANCLHGNNKQKTKCFFVYKLFRFSFCLIFEEERRRTKRPTKLFHFFILFMFFSFKTWALFLSRLQFEYFLMFWWDFLASTRATETSWIFFWQEQVCCLKLRIVYCLTILLLDLLNI